MGRTRPIWTPTPLKRPAQPPFNRLRNSPGGGGDAGADVEELADSQLTRKRPDRPHQELAILHHRHPDGRERGRDRIPRCLVGWEVVLASEPVVVPARWMRDRGVDLRWRRRVDRLDLKQAFRLVAAIVGGFRDGPVGGRPLCCWCWLRFGAARGVWRVR